MDRSDLEVVAQIRAGRSQRGAAAERSNLVALAHVRAEVKVVFIRNLLVESCDAIVTVTKLGAGSEGVISRCWEIQDRAASGGRPETRTPSRAACRDLARGKLAGKSSEHVAGSQADWDIVGGQQQASIRHPGRGRFGGQTGEAEDEVLLLVVGKNKRFVLDDWSARGESVVFVALPRRFGELTGGSTSSGTESTGCEEGRAASEGFVPPVVISGAVDFVAAGLGHDVYSAARVPSTLRPRCTLR